MQTRTEHDFLGDREIADDVYYGVQTLRAIENFPITGVAIGSQTSLIRAFASVKKAAAMANHDLGILELAPAEAIMAACDAILRGELMDQFPVDVLQGGAGTSTNMNVNEVVANKALEVMGLPKGRYDVVHPNNHVNLSQSTNDCYPTALRVALWHEITSLVDALDQLQQAFAAKGVEFADVLKMGRTQLQDAVPMTLGMEFQAFAVTLREDAQRLREAQQLLVEINLGGTAIGTGINAPKGYAERATMHLAALTGMPLRLADDLVEATWDTGVFVQVSGVLKRVAVKLSKICNDLRLLSSGPRAGINEINLPPRQPGSSIMPGKVNPVIPEVVNQVCFRVIGNDVTISFAAEAGQLQLNVMEPVIAYSLFQSVSILTNSMHVLRELCVDGITANRDHARALVLNSIGIVTALNPLLGYEVAASIAQEAFETGANVVDIVRQRRLVDDALLEEIFSIENLMNPQYIR